MKNIKTWFTIIGIALLFSSCIVKSLHAFYTKDLIFYESNLIGDWTDPDGMSFKFEPFKDFYLRNIKDLPNVSKVSMKEIDSAFNVHHYHKSYAVTYIKNQDSSWFQAMPFKIENQLFLDFILFDGGLGIYENAKDLEGMHLTKVHSLAKVDLTSNNSVTIKWLDEDKLDALIKGNRIKIKHERDEFNDKYLLTASSEELVKFIAKYMKSEDPDKWQTDVEFVLVRK